MEQYIPQPDAARTPPNHPESERSVLGAMIRSRQAAQLAVERLNAADFYDPANREIFAAMKDMANESRPVDLVTLDAELTRRQAGRRGRRGLPGGAEPGRALGRQRAGLHTHRR